MASEETAAGPRSHRLVPWFDPESAAVVTILLGLFQVLLSASMAHTDHNLPKLFILPLILGILIVAGGSFTMANERNPSRLLLRGCACSNLLGLLGSLLAFCLYCFSLNSEHNQEQCPPHPTDHYYDSSFYHCPPEKLAVYSWSITQLLLIYDSGAVVMHSLLSISAIKTLKKD
ncbi:uncharacterized protein si:dkey-9i23.16 isoform X2 [Melanotaenia boesemani]|uniref:uncharacterized protein si:dkey-9i23.16 isoform X2 n=1 Tax=Melanotaenia boesemani TaxID=1250792 RepID=UPI001C0425B2|nr:uncharacterized protein si:dkey-9i23.16 isoform X2 [Melanotaenia boesemani]